MDDCMQAMFKWSYGDTQLQWWSEAHFLLSFLYLKLKLKPCYPVGSSYCSKMEPNYSLFEAGAEEMWSLQCQAVLCILLLGTF